MIANPVGGKLDFQHLKDVRKTLFQNVYDWAGQTRTVEISKGPSAFAPVQHINTHAEKVFGDLAADNHLQGMGREQFLDRAAHHLGEINALHPFREGSIILSPRYASWEEFWANTSSLDDDVVEAVLARNDNVNESLR